MNIHEKYHQECQHIIEVCSSLYDRNMLAAADGNVSMRVEDGILMTPTGLSKARISIGDIALVSIDNEILHGKPSSERLMHLEVYRQCPEAKAVVHAHPPTAIAWTVAFPNQTKLPNDCVSELVLAAGEIPIVEYARPGTAAMGEVLVPHLPHRKIMVLSRHGALAWGESMEEARMGMERLEHSCEILYRAQCLGGLTGLPAEEMEALFEMRKQIGNRTL